VAAPVGELMNDYEITDAMITYGGGFVSRLGQLYRSADVVNQAKLKVAFPEIFDAYDTLAQVKAERQRQQDASA
jgi:hypothetical protein